MPMYKKKQQCCDTTVLKEIRILFYYAIIFCFVLVINIKNIRYSDFDTLKEIYETNWETENI